MGTSVPSEECFLDKKMNKIIITICFLFVFSCERKTKIDPVLMPYMEMFLNEGIKRGVNVSINCSVEFGHIKQAGKTEIKGGSVKVIINLAVWDNMGEEARELLIFHELGHAVLKRNHLDKIMEGCCVSIMDFAAPINCLKCYKEKRTDYLDELFK